MSKKHLRYAHNRDVFIFGLVILVYTTIGVAMRQLGEVLRFRGSEEDLLEVLDVDGTVAFMEL